MFIVDLESKEKIPVKISACTEAEIRRIRKADFEFNWGKELSNQIIKLELKTSNEVIGLIAFKIVPDELRIEITLLELSKQNVGNTKKYDGMAGILIAFACKTSFKMGFFGFVSLLPKTRLIDHYKTKYGFEEMGSHLFIDFERSENLIKKYLHNESE